MDFWFGGEGEEGFSFFFKIGLHTQCAPTDCGGNLTDGFARLRLGHGGSSQNPEGGGRIRLHFFKSVRIGSARPRTAAVIQQTDSLRCGEATVGVLRESTGENGFARLRASHGSCVGESSRGRTDSFAFFFSLGKRKIKVSIPSSRDRATVHRTVALKCSNPPPNAEKDQSERIGLFLVGEDGFEPSKRNAADLQSVPFGHSGTPPY